MSHIQNRDPEKQHLLGVVDVLLSQLGSVKPMTPAQMLPDKRDRHGCLIGVKLGHVQIINKVDQLFCPWWTIVDTSLRITTCCGLRILTACAV